QAREKAYTVVIMDTAGRLQIDEQMMQELEQVRMVTRPGEILLVVDAMTGQEAVNVAEGFNARVPLTGLIMTKIDGDARGGAALSVREVTGVPIKFLGTGEKLPDIEPFEPERLAGRILGMGDMLTLIERAQDSISEDEAASMQRKLDEGQFDFEDFLDQLRQVKKLGPLTDILSMLPGANRMMKDVDPNMAEDSLKRTEAIINSMTAQERRSPDILNGSRRRRIATGSGTTVQDVNTLIKQFREMQKMMKQMGIMGGGKKGKGGRRARGAMSDVMKMFNMN
ncbi:MAG: signal recognition particle protein, partial [Caldilineaceae bacterium]|nr:signal recognition particle protein [Caldilineaceae bacterium]